MRRSEAAALVAVLKAAWPRPPIGEDTAHVYVDMIEDLDLAQAAAAIKRLMGSHKWLPAIAEIRAEAARDPNARDGAQAWGDVVTAFSAVGSYRRPEFDDPITAEVARIPGWRNLCMSDTPAADRARFIEAYDQLAARERRHRTLGPYSDDKRLGAGDAKPIAELLGKTTEGDRQ